MFNPSAKFNKFAAKLAIFAVSITSLVSVQVLQSAPAQAADQITTSVTPATVAPGGKLNLITTMPQVSAASSAMQEVIQTIDPTKVTLTSAADVIVPAGWVTNFSQDGVTWLSTPTDWSAVTKVKATGPLNSGGLTQQGNQIVSRSVPIVERASTLNAAAGSGDGWNVEIDTRGYLFNTYHHSSPAAVDCRLMSTGANCNSAKWPFSLTPYGMGTSNNSYQTVDQVNQHLWLPNGDGSSIGFLCVDIADVRNPALCGGTKAAAWRSMSTNGTGSENIAGQVAANGMLFAWDVNGRKVLCFNYLANNGNGAPCASTLPPTPRVDAPSVASYSSRLIVSDGLVYGHQGTVAICIDSRTLGTCPGWASGDYKFSSATNKVYKQPNLDGTTQAVCFAPNGKCFGRNGENVSPNTFVNTKVGAASSYSNNPATAGTRLFWTSWNDGAVYCFDYANTTSVNDATGPCVGPGFTNATNYSTRSVAMVYTVQNDPTNPNCLWTNGDNGIITPVEVSTGSIGCAQPPTRATFSGEMIIPRMTCDATSGIIQWKDFVMTGVTKGVDYTSANLTIINEFGMPVVSNGRTWENLPFGANDTVDLSGLTSEEVGTKPTFMIDFAGRGTMTAPIGKISVVSAPAQMCLSLTAKVNLPGGYIYAPGPNQTATFSAVGSTTVGANAAINYAQVNAAATITPVTASQFGSVLSGTVTNGLTGASARNISGAEITLLNSSGEALLSPTNQVIRVTSDASGAFSFGSVLPGTYKLRLADRIDSDGVGIADARAVIVAGGTIASATVNFASTSTLNSNAFSVVLGTDVPVVAVYHLPGGAVNDTFNVGFNAGSGNVTTLDVLANDLPTTSSSWSLSTIKILNTAVTPNAYVAPTTLAAGLPAVLNGVTVGTYYVNTTAGTIVFSPTIGYSGPVPAIGYSITDNYTGTGGVRTAFAAVTPTVLAGPTAAADTMVGDFSELPSVNVLTNDTAASGATIDNASFKLCPFVGSNLVSNVTATGNGSIQTYTSAAPHGLFTGQYVNARNFTGTDASLFNVVRTPIVVTSANTFTIVGTGLTANISGTGNLLAISVSDCTLNSYVVASQGTYAASTDGTVTFTPLSGWSGTADLLTYMVKDSVGAPAFGTVQATVLAVPPVINTTALTGGQINVAYSLTLSGTAGSSTMKAAPWLVVGLPAGLTYNSTSGAITGTPTVSGTFLVSVTYTATDNRRAIQSFSLVIGQPPVITDANTGANAYTAADYCILSRPCSYSPNATAGSAAIPATGAWSVTAGGTNLASSGLTLNPDTGVISGTIQVGAYGTYGYFDVTVKVTDVNGLSDTHTYRLTVHSPVEITTAPTPGTVGLALSQAQTFVRGAVHNLYYIDPAVNGATWSATGLPSGITLDQTTGVMSGSPTTAGTFPITITVLDSYGDPSTKTVNWVIKARPSVSTTTLGNVAFGVAIAPITLQATLGTATALKASAAWSATGLPAGLTLNTTSGVISGTPTAAVGIYPVDVTVTDSASLTSVVRTMNITVVTPSAITTATPVQLVAGAAITPIQQTYTLSPNSTLPITGAWSATGLPAGLAINSSTGAITGTVSVGGAYNVIVSMVDSLGVKVSKTLRLNVIEAPEILTPTALAPLIAATAIGTAPNTAVTIDVLPGTANLTSFTLVDGTTLPAGLSLNASTGAITGTPTLAQGSNGVLTTFKIKVTDGNGLSDTETYTVWVGIAPTWLATTIPDAVADAITGRTAGANITLVQGVAMTPYNQALGANLDVTPDAAVTGGTFAISSGTIPAGLSLNPATGVISGTPTGAAATNYTFGVKFTDVNGLVSPEKTYVVNLVAPPVITTPDPAVWKKDVAITSFAQVKTNGTSAVAAATNPWTISPALPAGLVFNQTTGAITGTPTVGVDADFTVTYTDSYGLVATKVEHFVVAVPPTITTSGTLASAAVNVPNGAVNLALPTITQTVVRGTGTIPAAGAWAIKSGNTIPAGLWLNPNTGAIMGTPQSANTYAFTVLVTDSYGLTAEKLFNLSVYNPPTVTSTSLPFVIVNSALPTSSTGVVNSTHYKLAASAGANSSIPVSGNVWAASGLPSGVVIDATTGQLSGTPTTPGIYSITFTVTDNRGLTASRPITLSVVSPPTITTDGQIFVGRGVQVAELALSATPGTYPLVTSNRWSITSGALPTGLTLNANTGAITGSTTVAAADFPITVRVVDQIGVASTKSLVIKVRDLPSVTSAVTAIAAEDQQFNYPQTATAVAPATIPSTGAWSATGLPAGLSINPNTGLISGTPTEPGVYPIKVSVVDSAGLTGSLVETIEVGVAPTITTGRMLPFGRTGSAYNAEQDFDEGTSGDIPATGAWSVSAGSLPLGLTLNPNTGLISGTPTALGTSTFTLKLTNENGYFDTEVFTLAVLAPGANLTIFNLPADVLDGFPVSPLPIDLEPLVSSAANLPITYGTDTPTVCFTDSEGNLSVIAAGVCKVWASSGTGTLASKITQTFNAIKSNQTLTVVAPSATDDPRGFKLATTVSSGLSPLYEVIPPLTGEPSCTVEEDGTVTWQADLVGPPAPATTAFNCQVRVTQPGDAGYNAANPVTLDLTATHVEAVVPDGYVQNDPAVNIGLPRTGGTLSRGGVGFIVAIDAKKKKFTVKPISKGLYIGPIAAEITIEYKLAGIVKTQVCSTVFGITAVDAKKKPITDKSKETVVSVKTVTKPYVAMAAKGKKYGATGYLSSKVFTNSVVCSLNKDAYKYFANGAAIKATAIVTRDRRWPTTYARQKPNGFVITPTRVLWNLSIG